MIILRERREGDVERFEDALKDAKRGIKEACEIFEDMKEQFSERGSGSYEERYSNRGHSYSNRDGVAGMGADGGQGSMGGGMSNREWDDYEDYKEFKRLNERRGRDSMGRYR